MKEFLSDLREKSLRLPLAAILAFAAFTFCGSWLAPRLIGASIDMPAVLNHIYRLPESSLAGLIGHLAVGLVLAPLAFVAFALRGFPGPLYMRGLLFALLLALIAGLVVAPLAGMPIFFGSVTLALMVLLAHLAYGLVLAWTVGPPELATHKAQEPRIAPSGRM